MPAASADPEQARTVEAGAASKLGEVLRARAVSSVLLVTGDECFALSGAEAALRPQLEDVRVARFHEFALNPRIEDAERGVERLREAGAEVIVAVGGGSALDMAKLIAALSTQPHAAADVVTGRTPMQADAVPVVAIPTTAGTGSESTHFAVVYIDGTKYSLAHDSMRPAVALVDPVLTHSMGAALTAATGLDALAQAMESLWSVHAVEASRELAWRGMEMALSNLHEAVHTPTPSVRAAMSEAANLAGRAIDITKTTAPHALSYTMSVRFGVPHGHAVALTLGAVLEYNWHGSNDGVRAVLERIIGALGASSAAGARGEIEGLIARLGLANRLGALGIQRESDRALLVSTVNAQRLKNNPRPLTSESIAAIFESIV